MQKDLSRSDYLHGVQQVLQGSSERVAQIPRSCVGILPLQQRLLTSATYATVHTCEEEAQDAPNFAHLSWSARILLQSLLDKANRLSQQLLPWREQDSASLEGICHFMRHAEEICSAVQVNLFRHLQW